MEVSGKVRTPTQPRAQRTRVALLRAGEREFSANGYAATTSKSIARRAGVATGTFYSYFTDKDALLRELAFERQLNIADFALGALNENVPLERAVVVARARLTTVVAGVVAYHRADPGLHAVLTERRHVDKALDEITTENERRLVDAVALLLAHWGHRGDCEATAFVVFGMVEGAVHAHVLGRPLVSDERFHAALVEATLRVTLPQFETQFGSHHHTPSGQTCGTRKGTDHGKN